MCLREIISENYSERESAPKDVWDWQGYNTWRDTIWELIGDVVNDDVREAFLAAPPEYIVSDNLSWLDDIIFAVRGVDVDSKRLLADRIQQHYKYLRAVHGTRTSDLHSYYKTGIRPLDPEVAHERAREIFLGGEFPELNAELLERAICDVGTGTREGLVYFEANEPLIIKQAAHYLLYGGGEYLLAIAAHIKGGKDYRQVLKRFGYPTIFICDVPIKLMKTGIVEEFSGIALEIIFEELLDGNDYQLPIWRGVGFCLFESLPAEFIVGHYHPTTLQDPLIR